MTQGNESGIVYNSATFCEICAARLNYNKNKDYTPSLCKTCAEKHRDDPAVSMGKLVEAGDGFAEITP